MKRIALILALTSTSAMAEITPLDVIESWRTTYAGMGATITYDEVTGELGGKEVQLNNVVSVEILNNETTTSRFAWVRLHRKADGSLLITFSPDGERVLVEKGLYGVDDTTTTTYDFSAMSLVATGYPSDIRYSYHAPQVVYREISGAEGAQTQTDLTLTDFSGKATSITNVTESGPRVADFGEFRFGLAEIVINEPSFTSTPAETRIVAHDVGMSYRVEFPLTPILSAPTALTDMPPRLGIEMTFSSGPLRGEQLEDQGIGVQKLTFGHQGGAVSLGAARNLLSFTFSSHGASMALENSSNGGPDFGLGFAEIGMEVSMPFRQSDEAVPFSASTALSGVGLDEATWANIDPENAMGQPTADVSFMVNGLIRLKVGVFGDTTELVNESPMFVPDLSLESLKVSVGDASIEGQGDVQFNAHRTDPDTGLPAAKGEVDFAIIGALGFLDRFGRLSGVDPMMILGAKGGLGMFASPTDAVDSFTSKIEFLTGGGIVVNGQAVH